MIGRILKILGAIELVIAFVSLILFPLAMSGSDNWLQYFGKQEVEPGTGIASGTIVGVVVFIIGVAAGLLTFASGELFSLFISLEENSRLMLRLLEKQNGK